MKRIRYLLGLTGGSPNLSTALNVSTTDNCSQIYFGIS